VITEKLTKQVTQQVTQQVVDQVVQSLDPLTAARAMAQKMGLGIKDAKSPVKRLKSQGERLNDDKILELEADLAKEQVRYTNLIERARVEDEKRLSLKYYEVSSNVDPKEKMDIIRTAVEAGIAAQRQKKIVDDLELKLLTLKDQRKDLLDKNYDRRPDHHLQIQ
jgi:DNA-binding transcriptional regulator YhcF (GntR family)